MHIRRTTLWLLISPFVVMVIAAYVQWAVAGLPVLPPVPPSVPEPGMPHGFPAWLCITHYVNFFFIILLVRSGLQILLDHPRLYWNIHCTPGSEWIRFTPVEVPRDRIYTAKEDARYLSPWIGLPGGRHTLGLARHWHFVSVLFWVANGAVFCALLSASGQWRRLVPTSWRIVPEAWAVFVHYATFHLPAEPDGFYHYNALQQLSYFGVVFILAPLSILTGPSMSPALVNRFKWYPKLPGNRQIGRSLHFLVLCAYLVFLVAHVTMVAITGFVRNMNHIVIGTDDNRLLGVWLGIVGVVGLIVADWLANWLSNRHPRLVQHVGEALVNPVLTLLLVRYAPQTEYRQEDISPFFWPNGKMPVSAEWKTLAADGFKNYRLKVYGLVENPVELSLDDLRAMGKHTQITLHHCIQGWSGIAEWGGLRMAELMKLVRPKPAARAVVFYSFGEGGETGEGGQYYDSHTIENVRHPQALLAYEMNFQPLNEVHGAPLRLRVENQLGFKMVKWIQAIEFVDSVKHVYKGEGGYNADNEFFNTMADI
jgi:DMSO/TMAO reductase YedYZ molybdopterin-dependent catalytic subunit/thiosulfate reductase cytochrome b subunit